MGYTYLGTDKVKRVYLGTSQVKKIYLGTDIVFSGEHFINCSNCGANQTVTAVHSSGRTYTATADASGNATIKVYDDGSFTVSTPFQSQSKTINVSADVESMHFRYYLYLNGTQYVTFSSQVANIPWATPEYSSSKSGYMTQNCLYAAQPNGRSTSDNWMGGIYWRSNSVDVTSYATLYAKFKGSNGGGWYTEGNSVGFGLTNKSSLTIAQSGNSQALMVHSNASDNAYFEKVNASQGEALCSINIASVTGNRYVFIGGCSFCPYYTDSRWSNFYAGASEIYLD